MADAPHDSATAGERDGRPDADHDARPLPGNPAPPDTPTGGAATGDRSTRGGAGADESIIEVVGALIEDAGLYAQAEIGFQKTRAAFAGRSLAVALGALVLALILLHLALIALAVGCVIALAPLVTIWGAIAIVVGLMLAGVATLAGIALGRARRIAAMFADEPHNTGADNTEAAARDPDGSTA